MNRKQTVAVILVLLFWLTTTATPLSSQQDSEYDPWLDYNDDGIIDVNDLYQLGQAYSGSGDTTKSVNVTNFPLDEFGNLKTSYLSDIKLAKLNAAACNLWGYGDALFVGGGGGSPYQARLYRVTPQGVVEDLTYNIPMLHPGAVEIVAVLQAPNGDVFASTHPDPIRIIRLPNDASAWTTVFQPSPTLKSCYSIIMDYGGYLYFSGRHSTPERSIYRSTNKGGTWTRVWTETEDWIFGMDSHKDTIIAGANGAIIRSPDRGATWAKIPVTGSVRNVLWIDGNLWIAARGGYSKLLFSLDDGLTWIEFANTLPDTVADVPITVHRSPSGVVAFALRENVGSVAVTKNLATFRRVEMPVPGVQVRGVYLTEKALYVGGYVPPTHWYHYDQNVGALIIIPLDWEQIEGECDPQFLWNNETVTANATSPPLFTKGIDKQTFFFKADTPGTLTTQVYDEQTKNFEDFHEQTVIVANRLNSISLPQPFTAVRLKFSETATITCWAMLGE